MTPTVTVTYNGIVLTKDTDYTIEILNNTSSPDSMVEAVVLFTGKGDYYGTNTKTFSIEH